MSKNIFIFAHGFGFSNQYWSNLLPYFQKEEWCFFDSSQKQIYGKKYIGIGHSLGFAQLCSSGMKFECLIGLHGFLNFLGNQPALRAVRKRALDKMICDFQNDHINSLEKFHATCGYAFDSKNSGQNNIAPASTVPSKIDLLKTLHLLNDTFCFSHQPQKTVILGANDDKIVPISIQKDNFAHMPNISMKFVPTANHCLGHNNIDFVYQAIRECINQCGIDQC